MKLVPTKGVCSRYGRSDRTIDRWVETGELPKPIYIRGLRYWDEADLDARDEARKAEAAA
jgi:predicted DNA-binding transcriptional regulator AlpA